MQLTFTKMHGLGNDFIVINNLQKTFEPDVALIQQLANRRTGIGFDQMLIIEKALSEQSDFFLRIFNADGSESFQCGNGMRCVARYIYTHNLLNNNEFVIATGAGKYSVKVPDKDDVSVNMQKPIFAPEEIPFHTDSQNNPYTLQTLFGVYDAYILSMGNPHCAFIVDDINNIAINDLGKYLNKHEKFTQGTNVEFIQIINSSTIKCRIYERGVGETQACGSGACAAVVAGRLAGALSEKVTVEMPGGQLQITWQGKEEPVWMKGEAIEVFQGRVDT